MLFVDTAVGSKDLVTQFKKMGLPVEPTHLTYADVAFEGRGNDDKPVMVGIELKKMTSCSGDLMDSLRSGRLAGHQMLGLTGEDKVYDYAWLLIEGEWRIGSHGETLLPHKRMYRTVWEPARGGMLASEMEKRILTLELLGGIRVRHTRDRASSLHFISALYRWFTDTTMDRHTTHLVDHEPLGLIKLSDFRRAVMKWPGVGLRFSKSVEQHFAGSIRAAANADAQEWSGIVHYDQKQNKSRRFGIKAAEAVVKFCRGEK
jgi:ERCC4-type nuclease